MPWPSSSPSMSWHRSRSNHAAPTAAVRLAPHLAPPAPSDVIPVGLPHAQVFETTPLSGMRLPHARHERCGSQIRGISFADRSTGCRSRARRPADAARSAATPAHARLQEHGANTSRRCARTAASCPAGAMGRKGARTSLTSDRPASQVTEARAKTPLRSMW